MVSTQHVILVLGTYSTPCLQWQCCNQLVVSGVAKGGARGGDRPPNRKKKHSLKKAKSVEKLGGGGGVHATILEAETD